MFNKKSVSGLALAAVLAVMAMAGSALAFTNVTVNDHVNADNVNGKIALGSIISCNSHLDGVVTVDNLAGNGGEGDITGGSFSSCTIFTSASGNFGTAWHLSVDGSGSATITDISVNINTPFGSCRYIGSLSGTYSSGVGVLSGSLSRDDSVTHSCGGGTTENVSGSYAITDDNGNAVVL